MLYYVVITQLNGISLYTGNTSIHIGSNYLHDINIDDSFMQQKQYCP